MRYYNLSTYLREKYGKRLSKICIDGGFSCPNRDGTCGVGGCIFCGERGAGEHIDPKHSIKEQVLSATKDKREDELFIAYFQNFTNTYADTATLRERYDAALIDNRIKVLAIGTRPDCIDRERAELIASYRDKLDVWVELGLQTASDEVGYAINRGYRTEIFDKAVAILKEYGLPTVAHIIIGLPEDTPEGVRKTVDYVAGLKLFGVKIHSIYVMADTRLAELYKRGEYTTPSLEEYVELATYAIRRIPSNTVIHRLTGDCPRDMLVAPTWNSDKNAILSKINARLEELDAHQGDLFYTLLY